MNDKATTMKKMTGKLALIFCVYFFQLTAHAAEMLSIELAIRDGRFYPERVEVPANTKFKLVITNHGPGPEEFESIELRKEKVLAEGVTRNVVFQPLKPGEYRFFGEFHLDTAQGLIIVK